MHQPNTFKIRQKIPQSKLNFVTLPWNHPPIITLFNIMINSRNPPYVLPPIQYWKLHPLSFPMVVCHHPLNFNLRCRGAETPGKNSNVNVQPSCELPSSVIASPSTLYESSNANMPPRFAASSTSLPGPSTVNTPPTSGSSAKPNQPVLNTYLQSNAIWDWNICERF